MTTTRHRGSPALRVLALSAGLAAIAAAGWRLSDGSILTLNAPFSLPWWAFVPAFMATDALILHVEIRREAHSFSLSELPLVVGFFLAGPGAVIAGRLLGHLIYRGVFRRQVPVKLAFNLCSFAAESAVGLWVFRALDHAAGPQSPHSWLAIFLALLATDAIGLGAVTMAIRFYGGEALTATIVMTGAVTAAANTALAILAMVVLWTSPWSIALLLLVAVVMTVCYRSYLGVRQKYSSLQLLYEFTRMVGASVGADTVMDQVLAESRKLLRGSRAELLLLDPTSGGCSHRLGNEYASEGEDARTMTLTPPEVEADAVWRQVVEDAVSIVIPKNTKNRAHQHFLALIGAGDCVVAPLAVGGQMVGAIVVADRLGEASTFGDGDLQLFATLANHASVAFANRQLVDQLRREAEERRHEALHDSLTGLGNRTMFLHRIEEAIGRLADGHAAVMLMDLDRFKEVNDTLGHHSGDLLLQEVASRIRLSLRQQDSVARLGGDEFAVLLPNLTEAGQVVSTAERIAEALRQPFQIDELSVDIGASIGIALIPDHGDDALTLLQRADIAMYAAKGTDVGISVYDSRRDNNTPSRLSLAAELRSAINSGEIAVYHQPKARLRDGQIVGTEALVRWKHPLRGLLSPDEFVDLAEQAGLIGPLTLIVLRSALEDLRLWLDAGHDLGISVNLSVRNLLDPDLPERIASLLQEFDVPGSRLTLEITESGVMADPERNIAVLDRLAGIGVRLSVDDFGTGYSSLAYLRRLPVQEVKLDRSFVSKLATDAGDATIVRAIIDLARNLGLRTVAEGVEDRRTWDTLVGMGCEEAQGFLISRPVPARSLSRWLEGQQPAGAIVLAEPRMRSVVG